MRNYNFFNINLVSFFYAYYVLLTGIDGKKPIPRLYVDFYKNAVT